MNDGGIHLIVGAGLAGASAAIAMREAGFTGRIAIIGEEPHLPYDRPPLSKELLLAAEDTAPYLHPEPRYAELAIELMVGRRAEAIDVPAQRLHLADGTSMAYDRLLLATGGTARRLSVPGGENALYLRTLDQARLLDRRLRDAARVAVIGAGVIGLEVASSARARGCAVIVLEAAPGVLRRVFVPEVAEFAERLHRDHGVELRFDVAVEGIEEAGAGYRVLCGGGEAVAADLVFAGIGLERETGLAAGAGIETDGGIVVDEFGRTSEPEVFAAGDVASFWHPRYERRLRLEHWRHALDHGAAVGRAMCGTLEPFAAIPWFWTDQHGANFQVGGLPFSGERTVIRGDPAEGRFTAFHLAGEQLVGATTVNDGRNMRPALTLIEAGAPVDAAALADPAVRLRALLPARGR